ncbi:MAG: hypothetical protein GF383_00620 [Candidatus Lokiarchaeota archaeon]|nr:hypothetical protein [Candidatus Lokiarchaeota archaeon]MBD3337675.1 hypothetical protein [Candidatus Lokiarchaeota archaeon]
MQKKAIIIIAAIAIIATIFISWTVVGIFWGEEILEEEEEYDMAISGSTTCFPVIVRCAEEFMEDEDDIDIGVSGGGSSKGITALRNNIVDIGMASRELKASETGVQTVPFAKDGIAIVIDTDNDYITNQGTVDVEMSILTIYKIWTGDYATWDDVATDTDSTGVSGLTATGANEAVVLIGRDSNSGTRATWEELITDSAGGTELGEDDDYKNIDKQELNSNGAVQSAVQTSDYGIGYVGLGFRDGCEVVSVADHGSSSYYKASPDTVKAGTYPVARNLNLVIKGDLDDQDDEIQDFIEFVLGPTGQLIATQEDFVALY